ncbi:MAG: hypothetical protein ACOCRK_01005 [bacterium]
MKVLTIEESGYGSANVELHLSFEERLLLLEKGFNTILFESLNNDDEDDLSDENGLF